MSVGGSELIIITTYLVDVSTELPSPAVATFINSYLILFLFFFFVLQCYFTRETASAKGCLSAVP